MSRQRRDNCCIAAPPPRNRQESQMDRQACSELGRHPRHAAVGYSRLRQIVIGPSRMFPTWASYSLPKSGTPDFGVPGMTLLPRAIALPHEGGGEDCAAAE